MKNKIKDILTYIKENLWFYITLILIIIMMNISLPFSVYSPGGLINVDKRLKGEIYKSEGSLNLTYVTFMNGKVPNILLGLILPNWDIVKNSDITYDDETIEELNLRDRIHLYESISSSTYLAYKKALKEIEISSVSNYIVTIATYADTDLKIGDKILKVNGKDINNFEDILNIIKESEVYDKLAIKVIRNAKEVDCYAIVKDDNGEKRIGISASKINEYIKTPDINYSYNQSESGASGGLMLALAIYNALIESDITKGLTIAGTGTIDDEGNVGEISGIKYKLSGAVKNKSDIFLVPDANYEEAIFEQKKHNYKIKIIKATTFDQVLEELEKI